MPLNSAPIQSGIRTITPGEFMLQSAAVNRGGEIALGARRAAVAERQIAMQEQLAKQQMEQDASAMNSFLEWKSTIPEDAEPSEKMRAISRLPSNVWANDRTRNILSGWANLIGTEARIKQQAEEMSGIVDERKFRAEMYNKYGMPLDAEMGSPEWNDAIGKENESRKRALASTLGLQSVPEIAPNTPSGKWGLLDMNDVALQWRKAAPGSITGTTEKTPGGTIRRDVSMSMGEQIQSLRTQRASAATPEEQQQIDAQIAELEKNLQTLIPLRDQSGKPIPGFFYSPAFRTPVDTRSTIFKATGAMPIGMEPEAEEEKAKPTDWWGEFQQWKSKF